MIRLGLLGRGLIASARLALLVMEAVHLVRLVFALPRLLPVALCTRSFGFLVTTLPPELHLPQSRPLAIESARLAVDAVVDFRDGISLVVAFDMLPGLAPFAEHRIAIIIFERADAFDGIRLLLVRRDRVGYGAVKGRRVEGGGDRVRLRGWVRDGEGGGICHNPTRYPLRLRKMTVLKEMGSVDPSGPKTHVSRHHLNIAS